MEKKLEQLMEKLKSYGCHPSVYRRGNFWRAHVNAAGNFWEDNKCPFTALNEAFHRWEKAGKPLDGMASPNE